MKAVKKATRKSLSDTKEFDWICPNCLSWQYSNCKKMFCKPCNIEYDESEEGIKKYISDFEERELSDLPISWVQYHSQKNQPRILSAQEWAKRHHTKIIDADGWRFNCGEYPPRNFSDKISEIEFIERAQASTCESMTNDYAFPGIGPILPPSAVS